MRPMTTKESKTALDLFGDTQPSDRLVIRFDTENHRINKPSGRRTPLHGAVLIHYTETPAQTPTGGRYMARRLTVRTADGRRWVGSMKNGTDVVRLRPEPKK
jgi:hypothetical protein